MKKLLLMSMALFLSMPIIAQTRTVNTGGKTAVTRPGKFSDADGPWDSRLTLLKPTTPGGKTSVTRPGKNADDDPWDSRLTLLKPTAPEGKTVVTRPSRPSVSNEEAKTMPTIIDKTGGRTYDKTRVVRPTGRPLRSSGSGTRRR